MAPRILLRLGAGSARAATRSVALFPPRRSGWALGTRGSVCDRKCDRWSKLWGARSRLYRSRFLQSNIRWKALDEIYQIAIPLHRSARKISANFRQTFRKFCKHFEGNSQIFALFIRFVSRFSQIFMKISRIFTDFLENAELPCNSLKFRRFSRKKAEFSVAENAKKKKW